MEGAKRFARGNVQWQLMCRNGVDDIHVNGLVGKVAGSIENKILVKS